MTTYTIGFTQKSARRFFTLLGESGAKRLVDVRLSNVSQLAGFAKKDDLAFFLESICHMDYVHVPELAPTAEMFEEYRKKGGGDWAKLEKQYKALLAKRKVEETVPKDLIADGVLLCSEDKPEHCHRRLAAEYLAKHWGDVEIVHLG